MKSLAIVTTALVLTVSLPTAGAFQFGPASRHPAAIGVKLRHGATQGRWSRFLDFRTPRANPRRNNEVLAFRNDRAPLTVVKAMPVHHSLWRVTPASNGLASSHHRDGRRLIRELCARLRTKGSAFVNVFVEGRGGHQSRFRIRAFDEWIPPLPSHPRKH
jgi:hypothetical protein